MSWRLFVALVLLGSGGTAAAEQVLNLGLFAYRPKPVLEARFTPFVDHLSAALPGVEVRLRVLTQAEIQSALANNELDLVFTNPVHYIGLREHNALSGAVATLVNIQNGRPVSALGGVIVARAGSETPRSLSELEGLRIAVMGRTYMGGYTAPAMSLHEAGLDLESIDWLQLGEPQDRVINAVLRGDADAGFVRTGIIEQMVAEGRLQPGKLRVVNRQALPGFPFEISSRLYPEWPMVALPHIDPQVARRLTAALLAFEPDAAAMQAAGIYGFTVPADYAPVERAMRALGLPPYHLPPEIVLADVWAEYRVWLAALVSVGLLVASLAGGLFVTNRHLRRSRREAERAAARFEREHLHLRTLLNSLPQIIWLRDVNGLFLSCNERFEQLAGLPEAALAGRHPDEFSAALRSLCLEPDAVDAAPGARRARDLSVVFASDGHEELLEIVRTPVVTPDGQAIGMLGVGQDITQRMRQREELAQQRRRLNDIIEGTRVGTWEWNVQTGEVSFNDLWAEMIGYRLAELQPVSIETWQRFAHPEDFRKSGELLEKHFRGELDHYECEARMRHRDGSWVWVLDRGAVSSWTEDGEPLLVSGTHQDISTRKRAEAEKQELLLRLQNLAEHVPGFIYQFRLRPDGTVHFPYASPGVEAICGLSLATVREDAWSVLRSVHPEDRERVAAGLNQSARTPGPWHDQFRMCHADGRVLWVEGSASPLAQEDDSILWHGYLRDVTALKEHETQLDRIAHYDPLTGVPNRRLMMDRLRQAVARTRRGERQLGVCYFDIDGFKEVNDRCGHACGDALLVEIVGRLQKLVREQDTLARLGGDEFVVLLEGLEGPEQARSAIKRMLASLREPFELEGGKVRVSASFGLAMCCAADEREPDALLREADQAMYRAKRAGRDCCHVFNPDEDRVSLERHRHMDRLRIAMDRREFTLFYQPKVDLLDGSVIGTEALLRWQHPERGVLAPGAFLPELENTALELELGSWVLTTALRQADRWNDMGLEQVVSVNVSPAQLLAPDFVAQVADAMADCPRVRPEQIELEVVEHATMGNLEQAARILAQCRALGLRVSLDDFGTGYSSLSYLRRLPVDMLKIDQSFVRDMLQDPSDLGIVESVLRLARAFNRPVIAEGVETPAHGAMLVHLGCRLAQGYGIGMPMPPEDLPSWWSRWSAERPWERLIESPAKREQLFLRVVARCHLDWVEGVRRRVFRGLVETLPAGEEQCQFSHWYRGIGAADFGPDPEFEALGPLHSYLHALGDEMIQLVRAGQHVQARARLPAFLEASTGLCRGLRRLAGESDAGREVFPGLFAGDPPEILDIRAAN